MPSRQGLGWMPAFLLLALLWAPEARAAAAQSPAAAARAVPSPAAPAVTAQTANPEDAPRISQAEFKALHAAGNVLTVDVRDAGSYRTGHIPGAILIPLEDLQAHLQELKASKKPIVTYCG